MPTRINPPNPNLEEAPDSGTPQTSTIRLVVPAKQSKVRLDVYLTHQVQNATRNKVQQAIDEGTVLVDGAKVKASHRLSPGEVILVTLPKPPPSEAVAENIPLEILFEDEALIIVNKAAGMVTHPAYANYSGTLVNALLHHSQSLSGVNSAQRPGIVHRLDKDTTGLMVVAKTDQAHNVLAKQFAKRTIDREYWAVIWGVMKKKKGIIEASLGRSKRDRRKVTVTAEGKHAVTEYQALESFGYLSLVRLKLKTGRTHQIRVHLAHIGHPVFGDPTYGGRSETWGGLTGKKSRQAARFLKIINRQALHAKTLGFIHPATNKAIKFDSELPADMHSLLEEIRRTL